MNVIDRALDKPGQEVRRERIPGPVARERLLAALPVAERRLDLAGISTAVLEGGNGNGPPLVLLHGPGGYAAHWMRVLPALAQNHRVIAPDLPGHGTSETPHGPLDADAVLGWLDALVTRTCASPPTLVGELLGGAIAARYASRHADRLHALVLVDAFGLAPFQPAPSFAQALTRFQLEPTGMTHEGLWRYCAHDLAALRRGLGDLWQAFEAYNLDRACAPTLHAAMPALMEAFGLHAIAPSELDRIAAPTALVWGRHDLATPLSIAQAASTRHAWPLHVIDAANDAPAMEQPDAFVAALHSVLAKVSSTPMEMP